MGVKLTFITIINHYLSSCNPRSAHWCSKRIPNLITYPLTHQCSSTNERPFTLFLMTHRYHHYHYHTPRTAVYVEQASPVKNRSDYRVHGIQIDWLGLMVSKKKLGLKNMHRVPRYRQKCVKF